MDPKGVEGASPAPSEDQPVTEAAPAAEAAPAPDAKPAESSAADATDANKRSLADVVRDVVEPKAASEAPSTTEGEQGGKPEAETEAGKPGDGKAEDDDSKLPFHTHPRFQELIQERNELRPQAAQLRQITNFMEFHGLAPDEIGEGFEVMALLKSGQPDQLRKALEWFEPRVQQLRESLGVVLPADLQERVDGGLLDEETAKELAEQRATNALHNRQAKVREDTAAEVASSERTQAQAQAVATAVQKWEDGIKASDPDYAKKAEMVQSTALAMATTGGHPRTPEDAVALAQRAYDKVTDTFRGIAPKPQPKDTTTPAGTSARSTTPAPTSLRAAIEAAVGG